MRRILICRATSEQIHRGVQVAQYRLRAGDLVFFQTGPNRKRWRLYWRKPVYSCLNQSGRNGFNPDG
jgi:cell wall-associated NlpC family hydrolase